MFDVYSISSVSMDQERAQDGTHEDIGLISCKRLSLEVARERSMAESVVLKRDVTVGRERSRYDRRDQHPVS